MSAIRRKPVGDPLTTTRRHSRVKSGISRVTEKSLFDQVLKVCVLSYRCEPRFRGGGKRQSRDLASLAVSDPTPSFGDQKLPKEAPKLLQQKLNKLALNQGSSDITDPLVRRCFLAFYALLLDPDFSRRIKENRRAEDVVMFFISSSTKELAKSGSQPAETKRLVNYFTATFVKFLIATLREAGFESSCASLIRQLQSYESKLVNDTGNLGESNGSASYSAGLTPTFDVADIHLAKSLGPYFLMSDSLIQKGVSEIKDTATEQAAEADLRLALDQLKQDRFPYYQRQYFGSDDAYQDYKSRAIEAVQTQLAGYGAQSSTQSTTYYYIPEDPRAYGRLLVKICLSHDLKSKSDTLLSKNSIAILTECFNLWQIPSSTRAALVMDVCQELLKLKELPISLIEDSVSFISHVGRENGKREWDTSLWPVCDREVYVLGLKEVLVFVIDLISGCIKSIYEQKPPSIGPYLQILGECVFCSSEWDRVEMIVDMPKVFDNLSLVVKSVAEHKYDEFIDAIPRDHTLDPLHIIELADRIISSAERLQKRYKRPLLEHVPIALIAAKTHFSLFSVDSQSMFTHLMSHMTARHEEPSYDDMTLLYKKLCEIRELYVQVLPGKFPFDLEAAFVKYIRRHVEQSATLATSWVDPAIDADKWEPMDEGEGIMYSSSVADMFTSLGTALAIISELHWDNPVHVAQFYTTLMNGVSVAVCKYASRVFQLFSEELELEDDKKVKYKSRQEKWMAMAKNAMAGSAPLTPYQFKKTTCIKLNDIETAQAKLDEIEAQLDSEKLAKVLEGVNTNAGPGKIVTKDTTNKKRAYLFTIRIVQAENLKACDMNGLSDPYVTLVDQATRKQIGKTRTIFEELNPVWDETFEIATGGPSWLTATVWDEDSLGSHDLCGRAFLRLDPAAFGDFIAQDYWLDLDTQGKLLVNITMESERDDVRFYFGKALRTLVRCENDMIKVMVDKLTAFIQYSLSRETMKSLISPGRGKLKEFNMESVSSWLSSTSISNVPLTPTMIEDAITPLFDYLNESFATLAVGLTDEIRLKVMSRTWRVVLTTLTSLLLPRLSYKRTSKTQLSAKEVDIVFTWLSSLRDFFHHDGAGPSLEVLHSQQYQELMRVPVYYDLSNEELKDECEKLSSSTFKALQDKTYVGLPELIKRKNTVMAHRNRTVMRKQKERIRNAKREAPQNEDIILCILRMRGELDFVARRIKQKERLQQTLATESLVAKGRK